MKDYKIKDEEGNIYSLLANEGNTILSIGACSSYLQVEVQWEETNEKGNTIYPSKEIFVLADNNNPVDLIALQGEEIGKVV